MINSQLLLYLNLGFGLLLVAYFILGRPKAKQPTRLNMKATSTEPVTGTPQVLEAVQNEHSESGRDLGILFMYNGHDWEAHQVLGVPQGASMHQVTMAYQQLIKKADVSSLPFYEQAYAAISTRHRKHRL